MGHRRVVLLRGAAATIGLIIAMRFLPIVARRVLTRLTNARTIVVHDNEVVLS